MIVKQLMEWISGKKTEVSGETCPIGALATADPTHDLHRWKTGGWPPELRHAKHYVMVVFEEVGYRVAISWPRH
jgi:hypothetical protein